MTNTETDEPGIDSWCFQCGNGVGEGVENCSECGVPTTAQRPLRPHDVGDEDDQQLAYELHAWSGQGRSVLDAMLTRSDIAHAWQGATLIVREVDEDAVDEAVNETEVSTMPTLDLQLATVVYELGELSEDQRERLVGRLSDQGVSHAFDRSGDLFVYETDEERVDEVFDRLDRADPSERVFGPGIDADPSEVMTALFTAAGRLKKKPADSKGVVGLVKNADLVGQMTLPYGMEREVWGPIVDTSSSLASVLRGESELEEGTIEDAALALHLMLRRII